MQSLRDYMYADFDLEGKQMQKPLHLPFPRAEDEETGQARCGDQKVCAHAEGSGGSAGRWGHARGGAEERCVPVCCSMRRMWMLWRFCEDAVG